METKFAISELVENRQEAMITLVGLQDRPGTAAKLFGLFSREAIPVNTIIQNCPDAGAANISITVGRQHFAKASALCREFLSDRVEGLILDQNISMVQVRGSNLDGASGVAHGIFETLAAASINVIAIVAKFDSLAFIVQADESQKAVHLLRDRFGCCR